MLPVAAYNGLVVAFGVSIATEVSINPKIPADLSLCIAHIGHPGQQLSQDVLVIAIRRSNRTFLRLIAVS